MSHDEYIKNNAVKNCKELIVTISKVEYCKKKRVYYITIISPAYVSGSRYRLNRKREAGQIRSYSFSWKARSSELIVKFHWPLDPLHQTGNGNGQQHTGKKTHLKKYH